MEFGQSLYGLIEFFNLSASEIFQGKNVITKKNKKTLYNKAVYLQFIYFYNKIFVRFWNLKLTMLSKM